MFISDALVLDARRRTSDGYMAVRAKAARTGVYDYSGRDVDPDNAHGLRDQDVVKVYRDAADVFDRASVHSFIGKPITDNHPVEAVTTTNWRDHARGTIMGAIRDGDHVSFDLLLTDASTISAVDSGKRELSNGYSCEIVVGDGVAPDGTTYAARQTQIRGNHVAVVDRGRAGPTCRIADAAPCSSASQSILDSLTKGEKTVPIKTITFDGLPLEVTDAAEAVIGKLQGQLRDSETKLGTATAAVETKDGEIAALNAKLTDAEVTPEKLQTLVADRSRVIDGAKVLKADIVTDGKKDGDIRREAVSAKLGDATKDMSDDAINGAFAALTKDTKPTDALRDTVQSGVVNIGDAAAQYSAARDKAQETRANAWKTPAAA